MCIYIYIYICIYRERDVYFRTVAVVHVLRQMLDVLRLSTYFYAYGSEIRDPKLEVM